MRIAGRLRAGALNPEPVVWADFTRRKPACGLSSGSYNSILLT